MTKEDLVMTKIRVLTEDLKYVQEKLIAMGFSWDRSDIDENGMWFPEDDPNCEDGLHIYLEKDFEMGYTFISVDEIYYQEAHQYREIFISDLDPLAHLINQGEIDEFEETTRKTYG